MIEWKVDELGLITKKVADRDHFTPTYVEDGIIMVSPKDFRRNDKIDFSNCKNITLEAHLKNRQKTDLEVGDLVFTRIGALLGKICIVEEWMPEFSILHSAAMIRVNEKIIYSYYLLYFIKSSFFQRQIQREIQSIGVPDLGLDKIKKFRIKYPNSVPHQRKIAKILTTVDNVIEKTEQAIEKYKAIKQGMMHDLFTRGIDPETGKLRPTHEEAPELYKESELGWIPKDWDAKNLGDIGDVKMCKRIFSYETEPTGEIPFYKIGTFGKEPDAFISEKIFQEYRQKYSFPRKGNILVSASGTIGRTVVYDGEPAYFQDSNIIWIDNNQEIISDVYLYYIYQIVNYDTEGGTIQRLYNDIIKKAKFVCPLIKSEQELISSKLESIRQKIETEKKYLSKMQALKQGLMQDLLTGRVEVEVKEGEE